MKRATTLEAYPRIWRTVARIPRGKVASYGMVARLSGFPTQPRIAGYALHSLPEGIDIPWHRVINAQGRISLPGARGAEQQRLLEAEGIHIVNGRIDMQKFGWKMHPRSGKKRTERRYNRPI
jgi:methylated-DNA-protein-cysteine methyltransferase related protein